MAAAAAVGVSASIRKRPPMSLINLWYETPKILLKGQIKWGGTKKLPIDKICKALDIPALVPKLLMHLENLPFRRFAIESDGIVIDLDELDSLQDHVMTWYAEWTERINRSTILMCYAESKDPVTMTDVLKAIGLGDIPREEDLALLSYLQDKLSPRCRKKIPKVRWGIPMDIVLCESDELQSVAAHARDWYDSRKSSRKEVAGPDAKETTEEHTQWLDQERKQATLDAAFMEQFVQPAEKQWIVDRADLWMKAHGQDDQWSRPSVKIQDLGKYIPGATIESSVVCRNCRDHPFRTVIYQVEKKFFVKFENPCLSEAAEEKLLTDASAKAAAHTMFGPFWTLAAAHANSKKATDPIALNNLTQKIRSGRVYFTSQDLLKANMEAAAVGEGN
ncbi:MAG: hypothetical protein Hyperionvirus16_21 [Hyperionvirus sp.]|uniref:Uncharacterized protein n=1 Tax=Hyperionvirus sp. TaxID=2487770 RepID=A0A3G5A9V0_9VIRU|nr:MAG: hypothetical protein Hyperionvirus16_21 [Hyperionvirus sp.]